MHPNESMRGRRGLSLRCSPRIVLSRQVLALASAVALSLIQPGSAFAQTATAPHVTRTVQVFTQLEESLLKAIRERDAARLEALLGEEFEMIIAQDPSSPIPREDWIASVRKKDAGTYAVEQMSVREIGPVAIASFVLRPMPARPGATPVFVVDTWERADTQWQLTARHAAPVAGSRRSIPGDAKSTTIPKQI